MRGKCPQCNNSFDLPEQPPIVCPYCHSKLRRNQTEAEVRAVIERYRAELMALPYVVGIGMGRDEEGRPCMLVLLERELRPGEEIPEYLDYIKVITRVVGRVRPLVTAEIPLAEVRPYGVHQGRYRPVVGGISVGNHEITAGTLSCVISDRFGRKLFLSNYHVFALYSETIGKEIVQPGRYDGGSVPDDVIATLLTYVPITGRNTVDAAVALPAVDFEERIEGLEGDILDPVEANVEMAVVGSGRTTGVTHGTITATDVEIRVEYPEVGAVWFENQIMIEPGEFASPGDSGKLVLTEDLHPVGLIFAGSDVAAYANRFQTVLSEIDKYLEAVPPRPIWAAILLGLAMLGATAWVGIKASR